MRKKIINLSLVIAILLSVFSDIAIKRVSALSHAMSWQLINYGYTMRLANGTNYSLDVFAKFNVNGLTSFCVEPGIEIEQGTGFEESAFDLPQRNLLGKIAYYGYQLNPTNENYAITQMIIWEEGFGATIQSTNVPNYWGRKAEIMAVVNGHDVKPSFNGGTYEIKLGESLTLTDTNNVLSEFTEVIGSNNIDYSINGNQLTITPTGTGEVGNFVMEKVPSQYVGTALVYRKAGMQDIAYLPLSDPSIFNLNIRVLMRGTLEVNKTSEDGNVSGLQFQVTGTNNGEVTNRIITTNSSGKAVAEELMFGNYTVCEVNTPARYVVPNCQNTTIEIGETSYLSYHNILKKFRIVVTKHDSETGAVNQGDATLNGAVYALYDKNMNFIENLTSIGNVATSSIHVIDTYYVREVQPPQGYLLSNTTLTIVGNVNGQTVELDSNNFERRNYTDDVIKGKLYLFKHLDSQPEGHEDNSQIQTMEEGAVFEIYLKSSGSYANAKPTERDILTTDVLGQAGTKSLPYGVYTVKQIVGAEGFSFVPAFDVFISNHNQTYYFILENVEAKSLIEITKVDAETKEVISIFGIGFKVKNVATGEWVSQSYNYPTPTTIDVFYTDITGKLMMPELLAYGDYELHEVLAPAGYVLNTEPVLFSVREEDNLIQLVMENMPQKATISIYKWGEELTGFEGGSFIYEPRLQAGATYNIIANDDIIINNDLKYSKDDVVDTITTDTEGKAVSILLYLGSYRVEEINAPYPFTLNREVIHVTLTYQGQLIDVFDTELEYENERQKVEIELIKWLEDDEEFSYKPNEEHYNNVVFGLFAREEILNNESDVIVEENQLIEEITLNENGDFLLGSFTVDLPLGKYFIKELSTDDNYRISDLEYDIVFSYEGQEIETVLITANDDEVIQNDLKRGEVVITKKDVAGRLLSQIPFGLFNSENELLVTVETDKKGIATFKDVPNAVLEGSYIKELKTNKYSPWLVQDLNTKYPIDYTTDDVFKIDLGVVVNNLQQEIEIIKFKQNFSEFDEEGNPLYELLLGEGFIFDVYYISDVSVISKTSEVILSSEKETYIETSNYYYNILDNVQPIKTLVTDKSGKAGATLNYGSYVIIERSDDKYINADPITITTADMIIQPVITYDITNTLKKGSVSLLKVDVEDKGVLAGAIFGLYDSITNELLYMSTTDDNGLVNINVLSVGEYYFKELQAPQGYLLNDELINFEIKENEQVIELVMENEKIPMPKTSAFDYGLLIGLSLVIFGIGSAYLLYRKIKHDNEF